MSRVKDMTGGSPARLILTFAFPLMLTNIGQQFYMIADAAIVGRGVGVKALAAVGSTDWSYWLILWTVSALTQGFATFISRYFGMKDYRIMNKAIAMSALLCAAIGIFLTAAGLAAADPLLRILKTPEDIIDGAGLYLSTMIAGTLIVTAYNMAASVLRAFGDGRTPLIAMIIAAVLNVALDMLFVFVFKWGIFGAAIASVIAQLVSFLYCLHRILKLEFVELKKEYWKPDADMIRELLAFGSPLALQHIVIAIGGMILQSTINMQGSIFVAGYTAQNKLYGLLESTAISLGFAFTTYSAQNYGAGNTERVKAGVRTAVKISVLMAVGVGAVMALAGTYLLRLFIDSGEAGAAEALRIADHYLLIMSLSLTILYLLNIYRSALQSVGVSLWSMISGFAEFAVRVAMARAALIPANTEILYYIEPSAWLGALLLVAVPYYICRKKILDKAPLKIK